MARKAGRGADVPLFVGGAGSPPNNVAWAEAYLRTKWQLDPSSRLATTDMDRKLGAALLCPVPLFGGGMGPHLTQRGLGRGLPLYRVAS